MPLESRKCERYEKARSDVLSLTPLAKKLPEDWSKALADALLSPSFHELGAFLEKERKRHRIFPSDADLFSAFALTPRASVRAVILGQDPYHGEGQAHGLAFSVRPGVPLPPSLRNMFRELDSDIPGPPQPDGSLEGWARQGVLLLNTVLTVREGEAHSHAGHGWEPFTDAVLKSVSANARAVAFVLWGGPAQKKKRLIDTSRHLVLEACHPSPLSAHRGFFGSRPFSQVNAFLKSNGRGTIDWHARPADPHATSA